MALVGYSDSEGSDEDTTRNEGPSPAKKQPTSRAGFQKLVSHKNGATVRVNLPGSSSSEHAGLAEASEEPPTKKARLDGGGLGGFNAMLPAPKRATATAKIASEGRSGLRRGVSLKTGAAPGFTRELPPSASIIPDEETADDSSRRESLNTLTHEGGENDAPIKDDANSIPLKGKATMFRPLSVARKPQKSKVVKRQGVSASSGQLQAASNIASTSSSAPAPKAKPSVSLFSAHNEEEDASATTPAASSEYQPTLYHPESSDFDVGRVDQASGRDRSAPHDHKADAQADPQSLDSIASDLDLSAADRRRLFGRSGKGAGVSVTTFNTDAEYAANEAIRANQDLQEAVRPVRAIAPGKHSLRQLLNSAVSQKDALEDSFAAGRRNKKEAGSRYGW